jgi:tetratricopeptide (TPR) repeat protein
MFGWFKQKAECPLNPLVYAWLESRAAWIIQQFGLDCLRRIEPVLPHNIPADYRGTEEDARRLFARIRDYMELDAGRIELRFFKAGDPQEANPFVDWANAAGLYKEIDGKILIQLEKKLFSDPLALMAAAAHELSHVLLLSDGRLDIEDADGELVTDLLTIFLGFGVITSNSASRAAVFLNLIEGQEERRLGYLSDDMLSCAMALYAWYRSEYEPQWLEYLRPNIRRRVSDALAWLEEEDETTGIPRGNRFISLSQRAEPVPIQRYPYLVDPSSEVEPQDYEEVVLDHFGKGVFEVAAGRYESALPYLNIAIAENPQDIEAYQNRALAFLALNRIQEALSDGQKAVALDPDDPQSYLLRGKALMLDNQYHAAIPDFNAVIRLSEDRGEGTKRLAEAYFQRGQADYALGDTSEAIRDFGRAINKAPYRADIYDARAIAYEKEGKIKKAQRDRDEADYRRTIAPI